MAAKYMILWVISFFFLTDQALAQTLDGSTRPLPSVSQQFAWQGEEEERWREPSERINGIGFDVEGKDGSFRVNGTEVDEERNGGPVSARESHHNQLNSEDKEKIKKLRFEGNRKQQETMFAWKKQARKIKHKWGKVEQPSPAVFVEYTKNNNAFGKIDFQKGFLEVGAIAPTVLTKASYKLEALLAERVRSLFMAESLPGEGALQGQVQMPGTGRAVTQEDVRDFSQRVAQTKMPLKKFLAPDGVYRVRKQVRVDFMPNHLHTRAQKYVPLVERASQIYDVASELILAVIQTESAFNSRAVSHSGAVGLMQLMPATGALEASKLVYGEPKLMSRRELSRPEKNIDLGTAYLHILLRKYFGEYAEDPEKLSFLAIASYNCGPVRVKRALRGQDIDALSSKELYQLLMSGVPHETQLYLKRVVERMKQFRAVPNKASIWKYLLAFFSKPQFTFFH